MKIAVAGGKGGSGKTFIATNLASYISEKEKTALVDLDVEEPNSALFIRGEISNSETVYKMIPEWNGSECTLCGKCQTVCNFHAVLKVKDSIMILPELCHSCYACSELCPTSSLPMNPKRIGTLTHYRTKNLDFVESKLDIGEEQAVPLISRTNDYMNYHLKDNISICDCPPGTACPAVESVKDADLVILVAEPTTFGFHDFKLIVKAMKELGKRITVVINKSGIGNQYTADYCRENNIPVIAEVPHDRKLAEYYSRGELVYDKFEAVTAAFEKIYRYIKETLK